MKVEVIFITHLHGDHIFGLPGFLTSMILMGRREPITIVGPEGIKMMMEQIFTATEAHFGFEVRYVETDPTQHDTVFEHKKYTVESVPLNHKIPCNGYLFREKDHPMNIREDAIERYQLSPVQIQELKAGKAADTPLGPVRPEDVLYTKRKAMTYAYCTDTTYLPSIIPIIHGVDLLYHEATYMEDFLTQAMERGHSTARQAGKIAREAGVRRLLIGHPSSKYQNVNDLVREARMEYEGAEFAHEGQTYVLS